MSPTILVPSCTRWCRSPLCHKGSEHFAVPDGTVPDRPVQPDLAESLADVAMQARTPNISERLSRYLGRLRQVRLRVPVARRARGNGSGDSGWPCSCASPSPPDITSRIADWWLHSSVGMPSATTEHQLLPSDPNVCGHPHAPHLTSQTQGSSGFRVAGDAVPPLQQ